MHPRYREFIFGALLFPLFTGASLPQQPVSVLLQINRFAGSSAAGYLGDGQPAISAQLNLPEAVALDGSGNLYIADTVNSRIRRVDARTGTITTVAGTGLAGFAGDGGPATAAAIDLPLGVTVDGHGNLFIADTGNHVIREVNLESGIISTVAGNPNNFNPAQPGDGGLATSAALAAPVAVAVDGAGDLYIADSAEDRVRKVLATTGIISTLAGTGTAGYAGDNGPAAQAMLNEPLGVVVDALNDLFIADSGNNLIRKITSAGTVTTIAGVLGSSGYNGDGPANQATLTLPAGLAVDSAGNLYVADRGNGRIREVDTNGNISTIAGGGSTPPGIGALAMGAQLAEPNGVAVGLDGEVYVADTDNNTVQLVTDGLRFPAAEVAIGSPVEHEIVFQLNQAVSLSPPSISTAQGHQPEFSDSDVTGCSTDGVTSNPQGSTCTLAISFAPGYPGMRSASLQIGSSDGTIVFGLRGTGLGPQAVLVPGIINTILNNTDVYNGIALQNPAQIAVAADGSIYVADSVSNVVWRLDSLSGTVTVVAGGGSLLPAQADGGAAIDALLNQPTAIALDAAGNLYIAESGANRVRLVAGGTNIITTIAGTGQQGYSGDGGLATNATLHQLTGVAVDAAGEIFIADTGNNVIRRVSAIGGTIVTMAGNGSAGYAGDGGPATQAELNGPESVAIDTAGNLYIADTSNNAIRRVDPVTGILNTVAGNGTAGFSGDGAAATAATFNGPAAVAVDPAGDIYISDGGNHRVREVVAQSGTINTIAGTGTVGYTGDGGAATTASLSIPSGVALDSLGQIIIADGHNDTVRRVGIDAPVLDFGVEPVGSASASQVVHLSNIGNQPLQISQLANAVDFPASQDSSSCAVNIDLAGGGTCDLNLNFQPAVAGQVTENTFLTDNSLNASNAIQQVELSGSGSQTMSGPTATRLSVSSSRPMYATPIALSATVTGAQGPVGAGVVVFSINGVEIGAATVSASGVANVVVFASPTGNDVVTAAFHSPRGGLIRSSRVAGITVAPAIAQVTLTGDAQQIRQRKNLVLTAKVRSTVAGMPTGTIVFMDGNTQIGAATLNGAGQAVLSTTSLPAGENTIDAQYQGDRNFLPVTSNNVNVRVADDALTITINPNILTIAAGKAGQATVTLTPRNGFTGAVSLLCAGLPHGATCQFSSPTIRFSARAQGSQTVTLTVNPNTIAPAGIAWISAGRSSAGWPRDGARLLILFLGLCTLCAGVALRRARRHAPWRAIHWKVDGTVLVLLLIAAGMLSGCANLAPPQPLTVSVVVQAAAAQNRVVTSAQLQVYMAQ